MTLFCANLQAVALSQKPLSPLPLSTVYFCPNKRSGFVDLWSHNLQSDYGSRRAIRKWVKPDTVVVVNNFLVKMLHLLRDRETGLASSAALAGLVKSRRLRTLELARREIQRFHTGGVNSLDIDPVEGKL